MTKRISTNNGDELDAFSKYRRYHTWARGETKRIKRGYNKRFRKAMKEELNGTIHD